MRVATEGLLADFLREIKEVTAVQRQHQERLKARREANAAAESTRRAESEKEKLPDITMDHPERATFISENDDVFDNDSTPDDKESEMELRDTGGERGSSMSFLPHVEVLCQYGLLDRVSG